ncbi:MAG: hypothetical protein AB1656_13570 [Candidatus Omnitrophota bacterium]
MNQNKTTQPLVKSRAGRFQISVWPRQIIIKDGSFQTDRVIDASRVCIQFGAYDRQTRQWNNQTIWCGADDLRSLSAALDRLNGLEEPPESGDSSASDR